MNQREEKKAQFESSKKTKKLLPWLILAVLSVGGGVAWLVLGGSPAGPASVRVEQGQVTIPLAQVNDGRVHYFSYRQGETDIGFFLLQSEDGVLRAAFDACDVCYKAKKGYRQEGNVMVCNNCNQQFNSNQINEVKGGCNPAPLERLVTGDRVILKEADLRQGARYF